MRVLISGSTGLIGTALVTALEGAGHQPVRLVRSADPGDHPSVRWDPATESIDDGALDDIDAVVHLAGESIATSRWTDAQKARIMDSRVQGTRTLAKAMAAAAEPPAVFLSGSAIGYYGDAGDDRVTEASGAADDFAAQVTVRWEAEAAPIATDRTRLAYLRTGIVLDPVGGALAEQLPFFKLGLGGRIGRKAVAQAGSHSPMRLARSCTSSILRWRARSTSPPRIRSPIMSSRKLSAVPFAARRSSRSETGAVDASRP